MIISKTPLRMSFFGGGSDFRDYFQISKFGYGSTISTTVDMYVYITVNRRFDGKIRLVYNESELVDHVYEIKHNIIRNALKIVGIEGGVEVIYMADLPIAGVGIGLASSSALSVGVLNALHAYKGEHVSAEQLAREACRLEIEMMGQPIGIQDQYAVAYGGLKRYRFHGDDTVSVEPVVCPKSTIRELKDNLMLFFTGIYRDSGKVLGEQKKNIQDRMEQLDSLVMSVDEAYGYLSEGKVDEWGYMLDRAWKLKRQLAGKISNPVIDDMYEKAMAAGAYGGKVLGAGGGGFLLVYAKKEFQPAVEQALIGYRQVEFDFVSHGSQIIFMD